MRKFCITLRGNNISEKTSLFDVKEFLCRKAFCVNLSKVLAQ
jgi:hypothetical protein